MSIRKTIAYITFFIAFICLGIGAYFFYWYNKSNDLNTYIPADVKSVVYFNSRILIRESLKGKKDSTFKKTLFEKYPLLAEMDFVNSGIDIGEDFAVIESQQCYYLIGKLSQAQSFHDNIEKLVKHKILNEIETKDDRHQTQSKNQKFEIIWDESVFAVAFKHQADKIDLNLLIQADKNKTFANSKACKSAQNNEVPIWFFMNKNPIYKNKKTGLKGTIQLSKQIEIHASDIEFEGENTIHFERKNAENEHVFYLDTGHNKFNKELQNICMLQLGNFSDEITEIDFYKSKKLLVLLGTQTKENKTVTYEFDENFNKVAVEKISIDTIQAACLEWKTDTFLHAICNHKKPEKQMMDEFPKGIESYMYFNQNFTKEWLPIYVPFQVEYVQEKRENNQSVYQIRLSIKFKEILQ